MFSAAKNHNFNSFVMISLNLKLRTTFENSCNAIPCDVKYDGDYIYGLSFV
jgi:hypothetical protein